jgi:hypothetical protein
MSWTSTAEIAVAQEIQVVQAFSDYRRQDDVTVVAVRVR